MRLVRLVIAAVFPDVLQASAPVQTHWQRSLVSGVADGARSASLKALPALLARLDDKDVRTVLADCCPSVAQLPAVEIAERLRAELAVSEVVSGFNARRGHGWFGFSLEEGEASSHYENLWEVWVRHSTNFMNWTDGVDNIETGFYGLRPFAVRGQPRTEAEAQERAPYFALNLMRVDAGSPLYGDVSVVISPDAARMISLVAPFDTGSWTGMCNASFIPPDRGYEHDCSAYPGRAGLGTLESFDHLFLPNEKYWATASSFTRKLQRIFNATHSPLRGSDFVHYFEVLPAGKLNFPNHVKFLIASFPSLFGTSTGERLRRWCRKQGWPLVWSLGLNLGWSTQEMPLFWDIKNAAGPFPSNNRIVDPLVLKSSTVNATTDVSDEAVFNSSWQILVEARSAVGNSSLTPTELEDYWTRLKVRVSAGLKMSPLSAGSCLDVERCVGVSDSGHCLCKAKPTIDHYMAV